MDPLMLSRVQERGFGAGMPNATFNEIKRETLIQTAEIKQTVKQSSQQALRQILSGLVPPVHLSLGPPERMLFPRSPFQASGTSYKWFSPKYTSLEVTEMHFINYLLNIQSHHPPKDTIAQLLSGFLHNPIFCSLNKNK